MRGLRLLPLVSAAAAVLLLTSVAASAHAFYDHSAPGNGATVQTEPTQVKVWFSEDIDPKSNAQVVDASGAVVSTGSSTSSSDSKLLVVGLKPGLPHGTYTVNWASVASDDQGHLHGSFTFNLASAAGNATATQGRTLPKTGASAWSLPAGAILFLAGLALMLRRRRPDVR